MCVFSQGQWGIGGWSGSIWRGKQFFSQGTDLCYCSASGPQTILFTTEEDVLMCVALHDDVFFDEVGVVNKDPEPILRPSTADRSETETDVRPTTRACSVLSVDTDTLVGQGVRDPV